MGKANTRPSKQPVKMGRPALTPEARENQMISLAVDLAERQLREGTASSQVITHFLKQATVRAELEKEKIKRENKVLEAKAKAIESAEEIKTLYENALKAMRDYSGSVSQQDDDYDGYDVYDE